MILQLPSRRRSVQNRTMENPAMPSLHKWATRDLLDALAVKVSRKRFYSIDDLDTLDSRLQKISAVVRGRRNDLVPVNKLPEELLVSIFEYTQDRIESFLPTTRVGTYKCDDVYEDWLCFMHVCRRWRGIVATATKLWSRINSHFMAKKFLKRSGNSLISVYSGFRDRDRPPITLYQPHIRRIRELHVCGEKMADLLAITDAAPNLESLTMDGMKVIGPSALPVLFGGDMPRLRMLCMGYFTTWPSNYFRGLTHLCLYHQPFPETFRVTTSQFLDFLESSPDLEELVLVNAGPTRPQNEDLPSPPNNRRVKLPKLREFTYGKLMDPAVARRLLSFLSLPESTRLYFWGHPLLSDTPSGDIANFIPSNLADLPCLLGMKQWNLRCTILHDHLRRNYYLIAFVDKVLYTLDVFTEEFLVRMPSTYAPILRSVEKMVVKEDYTLSTSFWQDLFCCLPLLKVLEYQPRTYWDMSRGILAALYPEPNTGAIRTGLRNVLYPDGMLCPELKQMTLNLIAELQPEPGFVVSSFVKARKEQGRPLENLEFRYNRQDPLPLNYPIPSPFAQPLPPPPPPPPITETTSLERESTRVIEASVEGLVYLHDQEQRNLDPVSWPVRGFVWTNPGLFDDD